jgi:dienelactone hydrolase
MLKRLFKLVMVLCGTGVVALAVSFALLWHEHDSPIILPRPTGHFAVGRITYTWVNDAIPDPLSPFGSDKETVVAWIWYPASPNAHSQPADYFPAAWQAPLADHSGKLLTFLTRDLNRVHVHSTISPPVSPEQPSYPVVIMRAGAAAFSTDYTVLAEDLASHGYIVVGLDAPYRTTVVVLPDGRVIERVPSANLDLVDDAGARVMAAKLLPIWTADIDFVLRRLRGLNTEGPSGRFTGRFDFQRLGIFGHSFGGAQALQFCHQDTRCRAAIDIDGIPFGSVVQEGLNKPGMILLSDHSRDTHDPSAGQILADLRSIYTRLPSGLFVTIGGANHFSFSDQILLKSGVLISALMAVRVFGHLAPARGLTITTDYVDAFFDVYLSGAPSSQLTSLAAKNPEVQAESH